MIELIEKYWLEFLLFSISASILTVLKQYGGLKKRMISLLRNGIIRIYEKHTKQGFCPNYMK